MNKESRSISPLKILIPWGWRVIRSKARLLNEKGSLGLIFQLLLHIEYLQICISSSPSKWRGRNSMSFKTRIFQIPCSCIYWLLCGTFNSASAFSNLFNCSHKLMFALHDLRCYVDFYFISHLHGC